VSLQLKREKFLEHFANRAPCLIGMEACGGSQHWARKLAAMGHQIKLMPAKAVRPFVGGNKSDVHDARAIWTAVQQPNVKAVAVKTEEPSHSRTAPHVPATSQIPHRLDQRTARSLDRIR
jgi:transposase